MDSNDRKLLRLYARSRLQELLEESISPRLADRASRAEANALEAVERLFQVYEELDDSGKSEVASALWLEFFAALLLGVEKEDRKEFLSLVLRVSEAMEEEVEGAEAEAEAEMRMKPRMRMRIMERRA